MSSRHTTIPTTTWFCLAVLLSISFVGPAAASVATPSVSAIPAGFRAQSLTWTSPKLGWMLGVAPCGATTCTTVLATTNGGGTWNTVGTLPAPLSFEKRSGVTGIRFADALHGWAFGPALWATTDGGATWQRQAPPGGGRQVPALAADADAVYALVNPCRLNAPPSQCKPATLWRTTAGSGSWTQVSLTLPAGLVTNTAVLAVHGVVAYLAVPTETTPDVLDATVDGQHWSSRPDPCVKAHDEMLVDVAPISDTNVALLCVGDPGVGQATKRVLRSNDTGMTSSPSGSTPRLGIVSLVAGAPNGTLVVSSWSAPGSWIYRHGGGQTWTTSVAQTDSSQGWNDLVFTTNRVGFAVYGPAAVFPGDRVGELWLTQDGGLTWAPE